MPPIPSATNAQDLHRRLQAHRDNTIFASKRVALNEVDAIDPAKQKAGAPKQGAWTQDSVGNIGRTDGRFFSVQGALVSPKGASAGGYYQPMLVEEKPGKVVLVRDKKTGDILLDMKTEAGTDPSRAHTSFSATLQVSMGNLELPSNAHSAAHSLLGVLMGLGLAKASPVETQEDPGRFFNKRNELRILEVTNKSALGAVDQESLVWTKPAYLFDETNRNECNAFLWQSLGLLHLSATKGSLLQRLVQKFQ